MAVEGVNGLEVAVRAPLGGGFAVEAEFAAPAGVTILFGPSGAGKTTVLNCVAGLLRPAEGRIAAGGELLFDSAAQVDVPVRRRQVGYVFQTLALFPHMTAEENVRYGIEQLPEEEAKRRSDEVLESFGIAHLCGRRPGEISGGERQRVALARTLVTEPRVLLLDEPLAGLDAATKSRLLADLRAWNRARGIPILYVTHDRAEVYALGERVIFIEGGRVVAQGTPQEVLEAPRRETVAQAAGFENIFDAMVVALHEQQGTMSCRVGAMELEVPLGRQATGDAVRVAVRAGDILLASERPRGLSARNVLAGKIASLERRGAMVVAEVDCGVRLEVHVTPGAVESLGLAAGKPVWAVVKTYSCHLLE